MLFFAGLGCGLLIGAGIATLIIALCRAASCQPPEYEGEQG